MVTRCRRHAPELVFAALLALGAAIVLLETRGLSFYFDDWEFVLHRRGLSADVLLRPHGPHLSLIPILLYKLLLAVFGGTSYLPFRMLAAFDLLVVAAALGLVTRRLWGRWWGLIPVALLVTLGPGAWTLLWSFQVGYTVADAAGVLSLVALAWSARFAEPLAAAGLTLSLASGSQGVGFLAGAALLLFLRGRPWRSVWVVALPAFLYAAWYLKYGHQASETHLSLWRDSLPYVMRAFSSTISGLLGLSSPSGDLPPQLDPSFGVPLAVGALLLAGLAWRRGWRPPPLFWAAAGTLLILWLAASLSNVDGTRRPTDSRYLSTSAVLLLICLCAAVPRPRLRTTGAALGGAAAMVAICATNAGQFTLERNQMLATGIASRAEVGALNILRGVVPPTFTPVPPFFTGLINDVQAGPFFSAVDAFGIVADSPATLLRQTEGTRELTDGVLRRGELIGLTYVRPPRAAPAAPAPTVVAGAAVLRDGCVSFAGSSAVVLARPGTLVLTASRGGSLQAAMGRFATAYTTGLGTIPPGRSAAVHVPADHAPRIPWRLLVHGRGRVCA